MSLTNFQAGLFFPKERGDFELVAGLGEVIPAVNRDLGINLRPLDETSAAILNGNEALFRENGDQLFLAYDEQKVFHGSHEWILHVSVVSDFPQASSLHFTPELPELTRELVGFVWERFLTIINVLVFQLQPLIAQMNGLDDEEGGQIISPKSITPGALPHFFTPYVYLDKSLIAPQFIEKIKTAGAHKVEACPNGWSLQFVKDFYSTISPGLLRAISSALPAEKSPYRQTVLPESSAKSEND